VDLAEPDAVEALGLPGVGQIDGLAQRRALADAAAPLLEKDPEVHGPGFLRPRILRRGLHVVK